METTTEEVKPVAELTIEEALAELAVHKANGFSVPEIAEDAKITALRKLVGNARKSIAPAPVVAPEVEPVVTEPVPETSVAPVPAAKEKIEVKILSGEGPITVVCSNGKSTRVYSRQTHGAVYKTLAANYAEHNQGKQVQL